jgi:FtsP/CotA-like multicopper oxidase with cupredoxin domain
MVLAWRSLFLFIFVCSLFIACIQAKVHYHKWEISYQFKSLDCLKKLAITINGQTPGPTIYATEGDTVVVQVKNSLVTENVAIHWHGIRQVLV